VTLSALTTNSSTTLSLTGGVSADPTGSGVTTTTTGGSISIAQPTLTSITVTTNPSGLGITVDGSNFTAPRTFNWTAGSQHTINTAATQGTGGTRYTFSSWSDGGAASHQITAPGTTSTFTANFQTSYQLTTGVSPAGSGSVSANPSSSNGFYPSGTQVQLTA